MAQLNDLLVLGNSNLIGETTIYGRLTLANTEEASLSSSTAAFRIGDINGTHLAIDGNEINAKSSSSASGTLYLNNEGGTVQVGTGGINSYGNINIVGSKALCWSSYGGGWYMSDTTYIRNYGSKQVLLNALLTTSSGASHSGIKIGDTYVTAIGGQLIFQNNSAIRFGTDSWDYNQWAGLKYDHSKKYIYLGLADGTIFQTNASQSGGRIFTPGIDYLHVGNQTTYYMASSGDTKTRTLTIGHSANQSTSPNCGILIHDLRSATITPGIFGDRQLNFYFDEITDKFAGSTTDSNRWSGIMHVKGWTGGYAAWELAGNAHTDSVNDTLRYRQGVNGAWGDWQSVLTDATYHLYTDGRYVNVTGDTMTGTLKMSTANNVAINFRPGHDGYYTTMSYQTSGNEALVFATKNAVTSFIFANGEDSVADSTSARWTGITPGLQIKNNSVYIGELIANGVTPSYKFLVNGTSYLKNDLRVDGHIFAYNYTKDGNNAPAIVFDKNGSNYTGIGSCNISDTIYFGPVSGSDFTWVPNFYQIWKFQGAITLETGAGSSTCSRNYISAGRGYSVNSGKNGLKVLVTEQNDAISGLGQDCTGKAYELNVAAALSTAGEGYISFVGHKMASLSTYSELAHFNFAKSAFYLNGKLGVKVADPTVEADIRGSLAVINDASNTTYDALGYFRHFSSNDWGIKIDKNGTYDYGLVINTAHTSTYALQVTGASRFSNTLRIGNGTAFDGDYCEGIRIRTADGQWSTIIMGATADTGTNTNAWSIHRKSDNNFCISRNSSDGSNGLVMTSTGMGLGTTAPGYRFHVVGKSKFTNRIYADEWIEFAGATGLYFPGTNCNGLHILPNQVGSYAPVRVIGTRGGYNGIHFGDNNKGLTVMSCEPHQGLYNESTGRWILYYKRDNNLISIGNSTVRSGYINIGGSVYTEGNIYINNGGHAGIGLYNTSSPNTYGIHMSTTGSYGTFGAVSSDWATYFCFDGEATRGWIFKHAGTNVASINGQGIATFKGTLTSNRGVNINTSMYSNSALEIREYGFGGAQTDTWGYAPRLSFHWAGRVAAQIGLASNGQLYINNNTQSGTSFYRIVYESGTWGIGISGNAATATTASTANTLGINATANLSNCLQYIQQSSQTSGNDLPAASWHHVLKMNHGTGDTQYKRLMAFDFWNAKTVKTAVAAGDGKVGTWYKFWLEGDAVTSAVWNDYAECREADTVEAGYVLCETGNDSLVKTVERLQHFAGVSSDTWGFSQGETEKAKTPIAVAGRVLVYPYQDRNNYKPGDCVCAAPGGNVDIMTREEIINYPDRIVGTVSCVPKYDTWGGGENADREPVKVNGRIWIKVR